VICALGVDLRIVPSATSPVLQIVPHHPPHV
jgi:hypothetical protein